MFLHHPRWHGGKLRQRLGDAFTRRLVGGGQRQRPSSPDTSTAWCYDGVRDDIEYFTLATTGGHQGGSVAEAGYLHHFHVVTVRGDKVSVAALPVGGVLDPREITGEISDDVGVLERRLRWTQTDEVMLGGDASVSHATQLEVRNPCGRPIEVTVTLSSADQHWRFAPDHRHVEIPAGEARLLGFELFRPGVVPDANYAPPRWTIDCDYLGESVRISIPERSGVVQVAPPALALESADAPRSLSLDGDGDYLRLAHKHVDLPDGPFTLEAWLRGRDFAGRRGLVAKTENSGYGLFVSDGKPTFSVHLNGAYVNASIDQSLLKPDVWHHVAGVFDGKELRLYVDGLLIASQPGEGKRSPNSLPLLVGADVTRGGAGTSFFDGQIDDVRLSIGARYEGEVFEPRRAWPTDDRTHWLLHLDLERSFWMLDRSGRGAHPERRGDAHCVSAMR